MWRSDSKESSNRFRRISLLSCLLSAVCVTRCKELSKEQNRARWLCIDLSQPCTIYTPFQHHPHNPGPNRHHIGTTPHSTALHNTVKNNRSIASFPESLSPLLPAEYDVCCRHRNTHKHTHAKAPYMHLSSRDRLLCVYFPNT